MIIEVLNCDLHVGLFLLKDFLRDKWVCDAKTKRLIADPWFNFSTLHRWMRIEWFQRTSAQFKILNGLLDPKPCLLARWTSFIRTQQNVTWKGIGGSITEVLVAVRRLTYDECKTLKLEKLTYLIHIALRYIPASRSTQTRWQHPYKSLRSHTGCSDTHPCLREKKFQTIITCSTMSWIIIFYRN